MKRKKLIPLSALAILLVAKFANGHEEDGCKVVDNGDVRCRLRALSSSSSFGDVDIGAARVLKVECSNVFFGESLLQPALFGNLPRLETLEVNGCKLRSLPKKAFAGMPNLKRLAVRTRNADWADSAVLNVEENSLENLRKLQHLDLSLNNLWTLPSTLFDRCQFPDLKTLNLSRNHLTDLSLQLGEKEDCASNGQLETLDLSSNFLNSIRDGDLVFQSAKRIDLSKNKIGVLGDSALKGLTDLESLDLSSNRLVAIPPSLFNESSALKSLKLDNNSLTLLPGRVFAGLEDLVELNLSRNAIADRFLARDSFADLTSLQVLDLSENKMAAVGAETFAMLPELRILRLSFNAIKNISPSAFIRLGQLKSLSLSGNELNALDAGVLQGLDSLSSLSLDRNEIAKVALDAFTSVALTLEDLTLDNNKLSRVPKAVSALVNLRTLDLGENEIREIRDADFADSKKLYGLRLAGNELSRVTKGNFANSTALHVLNLARNRLESIEQGTFDALQSLKALRLDNNLLSDINGIVSALGHLRWFNASSNRLQWFDYAFVPTSLEWLDLHANLIEELGNYYKLRTGFNLKTLDAGANRIKKLTKLSLPTSLVSIALNGNAIDEIEEGAFEDLSVLEKAELGDNELAHLKLESLRVDRKGKKEKRALIVTDFLSFSLLTVSKID